MKFSLLVVFGGCFLFAAPEKNISLDFVRSRAEQVSDVRYDLMFWFDKKATEVTGNIEIQFTLKHTDADLVLDFAGRTVTGIRYQNQDIAVTAFKNDSIKIPADKLQVGANLVEVNFKTAYGHSGAGLHYFKEPDSDLEYLYTDLQPNLAHTVFPCFDQPDLRAVFKLTLVVPPDWQACTNGAVKQDYRMDEERVIVFERTPPIATYLFNMVVGDYGVSYNNEGPVPMRLLYRQSMRSYIEEDGYFEITRKGMTFFETYFQMPYPFKKYDQSFVPQYNHGAMENPGSVILNESFIIGFQPSEEAILERDQVILHELAHMWFGNLVTMKWWDDLWLNEGFASYMELIALRGLGKKVWHVSAREKIPAYMEDLLTTSHPVVQQVPDTNAAEAMFDAITYRKGQAVLRQMEFKLGEHVFRDGIRRYLQQHAWENTTHRHYFEAMERAAKTDLDPWVDSWLFTAGNNQVQLDWKVRKGKISAAVLTQKPGSGDGKLRTHHMLIGLFREVGGKVVMDQPIRVVLADESERIQQLKGKTGPDFILPNLHDYAYVQVILDPVSRKWLEKNIGKLEPEYQEQVQQIMWQMFQSGNLKPEEYLAVFKSMLLDPSNFEATDNLIALAHDHLPPAEGNRLNDEIFLRAATDLQTDHSLEAPHLHYFVLAQTARTTDHQKLLMDILTYKVTLTESPGLYSRWMMACSLNELGASLTKEVLEDLKRDSDLDTLARFYERYKAMEPTRANKKAVWEQIVGDGSLAVQSQLMSGFHSRHHPELSQLYIEPFFNLLPQLYQTRDWDFTEAFAEEMFPRHGGKAALLAAQKFLAKPGLPPALVYLVKRQSDLLNMALKIKNP